MARLKVIDIDSYISEDTGVISRFRVIYDDVILFECLSLEQPWLSNAPYESCIPAGLYKAKLTTFNATKNPYPCYEILTPNTPRSHIKIHIGNNIKDILGCVVVGDSQNRFGNMLGVSESRSTYAHFMEVMGEDKEAWVSVRRNWR